MPAAHIAGMSNSASSSRVSPGVPAGGQFAAQAHPDSGISLATETPVLTAVAADRHAEALIGEAMSMTHLAERFHHSDDERAAYYTGVAEASARAAATFITDDPDPTAAAARILTYSRAGSLEPAAIRRKCADGSGEPPVITAERAESEFVDAVDRAYSYHQVCRPSVAAIVGSAEDWYPIGLRNATAYAAARWANLADPDAIAGRSQKLQQALRDGVNVSHILRGAARGTHLRDLSGYWYDTRDPEAARLADLD